MNGRKLGAWLVVILAGVVIVGVTVVVSLRQDDSRTGERSVFSSRGGTEIPSEAGSVDLTKVKAAAAFLSVAERRRIANDESAFIEFLRRELARQVILSAARAARLDRQEAVVERVRRQSEQVLIDAYLAIAARKKVPDDFPKEARMREFYRQNADRFVLGERVNLWQIFIPDGQDAAAAKARALDVARQIRSGELSFEQAAQAYSKHQPSRLQGGNMGVVAIAKLLPELRSAVSKLDTDTVAGPVRGPAGWHLLRRGALLPAQALPYARVASEIRGVLRRSAMLDAGRAVLAEEGARHNAAIPADLVTRWRREILESLAQHEAEPD